MSDAVDYSLARPTPDELVAAGYSVVMRYLSHEPAKNLTLAERDALHAAGLAIGLVWETTADRTLAGFDAGVADATDANDQADALGWPGDRAIFYAVDFDASTDQVGGLLAAYFHGAASVGRRPVGAYGSYRVIEGIVGGGVAGWGWQCAAWSGSGTGSGGSIQSGYTQPVRLSFHACLFQHYGLERIEPPGATDHNSVLTDPTPWSWHPDQPKENTMPDAVDHIIRTTVGSDWALKQLGNNEQSHVCRMNSVTKWIDHLNPDEYELAEQLLQWDHAVNPDSKDWTIVDHPDPLPDVWFRSGRFRPAP